MLGGRELAGADQLAVEGMSTRQVRTGPFRSDTSAAWRGEPICNTPLYT